MHLLSADETRSSLDGLVHFDTQSSAASGLDLTAAEVFALTSPGQIDFGGSEARPAERRRIEPEKEAPDDDYGWWDLEEGTYIVRYNEAAALQPGQVALVVPHERLLVTGARHAAFAVRTPHEASEAMETPLAVGRSGLRIKENARLSTLLVFEEGA